MSLAADVVGDRNRFVWVVGIFVAMLVSASLALVSHFTPFVPDYDGLSYYGFADHVKRWMLGEGDGRVWMSLVNRHIEYWPLTNGPSVYLAAIFGDLVHRNYLPLLANAVYLAIFASYMVRLRGGAYTLVVVVLLCSNTFIFRLFTTFTSEFAVGLWIIVFLATLSSDFSRRGWALALLVTIGVAVRAVDVVFILGATMAFALTRLVLMREAAHAGRTLAQVFIPLLVTLPLFWDHYSVAFDYVRSVSFGDTAEAWKSLAGVSGRLDVALRYFDHLNEYNPLIHWLFAGAVVFRSLPGSSGRREVALVSALFAGVAGPLMLASSLNVQVVFWVYAAMIFVIAELLHRPLAHGTSGAHTKRALSLAVVLLVVISLLLTLPPAWTREVRHLRQIADYSRIGERIWAEIGSAADIHNVASNYYGIGPLDVAGLRFVSGRKLDYKGVRDYFSRGIAPASYLKFDDSLNLFISAHDDYSFPPHFGINDVVAETHREMLVRGKSLGFRRVARISDRGRGFDLWYRPGMVPFLPFESYLDFWVGERLPVQIGDPALCGAETLSGRISLHLEFPGVDDPAYKQPFEVTLVNDGGEVISGSVVDEAGRVKLDFDVLGIRCGDYRFHFSHQFSTAADPRRLSALYLGHDTALRFGGAR